MNDARSGKGRLKWWWWWWRCRQRRLEWYWRSRTHLLFNAHMFLCYLHNFNKSAVYLQSGARTQNRPKWSGFETTISLYFSSNNIMAEHIRIFTSISLSSLLRIFISFSLLFFASRVRNLNKIIWKVMNRKCCTRVRKLREENKKKKRMLRKRREVGHGVGEEVCLMRTVFTKQPKSQQWTNGSNSSSRKEEENKLFCIYIWI